MEKLRPSGFSSIDEFESSVYKRLRPLAETHDIKIEQNQPIKVRPANTYFSRDRSWRCSFLCGLPNQFVLVEARLDFNPLWLMQLEMLAAYNPSVLQQLIIVCPKSTNVPNMLAQLTIVPPELLIDRIASRLNLI